MLTTLVTKCALDSAYRFAAIGDYVLAADCMRFAVYHSPESCWRFIDSIPNAIPQTAIQRQYLLDAIDYAASEF